MAPRITKPTTTTTTTTTSSSAATRAPRKKKVTGTEPTRRSTRTVTPREVFSTGVTKAPARHHKRKPKITDKIVGAVTKIKGAVTRKPGVKSAGTRRMRGTDGRKSRK